MLSIDQKQSGELTAIKLIIQNSNLINLMKLA